MIEVLDKGFVRLVDHMGSDLSIVRAARVSFNADWRSGTELCDLAGSICPVAIREFRKTLA